MGFMLFRHWTVVFSVYMEIRRNAIGTGSEIVKLFGSHYWSRSEQ